MVKCLDRMMYGSSIVKKTCATSVLNDEDNGYLKHYILGPVQMLELCTASMLTVWLYMMSSRSMTNVCSQIAFHELLRLLKLWCFRSQYSCVISSSPFLKMKNKLKRASALFGFLSWCLVGTTFCMDSLAFQTKPKIHQPQGMRPLRRAKLRHASTGGAQLAVDARVACEVVVFLLRSECSKYLVTLLLNACSRAHICEHVSPSARALRCCCFR